MNRTGLQRIADMREHAAKAMACCAGRNKSEVLADERSYAAILFHLAVTGEAARMTPPDIRAASAEIPWAAMAGMRNHIIHAYWQIDHEIVFATLEQHLAPLLDRLDQLADLLQKDA